MPSTGYVSVVLDPQYHDSNIVMEGDDIHLWLPPVDVPNGVGIYQEVFQIYGPKFSDDGTLLPPINSDDIGLKRRYPGTTTEGSRFTWSTVRDGKVEGDEYLWVSVQGTTDDSSTPNYTAKRQAFVIIKDADEVQPIDPVTGSSLSFIDRDDPIDLSIGRLYTAAFGRVPDEDGFFFWRNQVRDPLVDYQTIAVGFNYTPEFKSRVSGETLGEIITGYYENVLGRTPDQGGINYWVGEVAEGRTTIEGLLLEFANSPENIEFFNSLL